MILLHTIKRAALLICLAVLAASCSSSDASSNANYVAVGDDASTTAGGVSTADPTNSSEPAASTSETSDSASGQTAPEPVGDAVNEVTAIVQVFDDFLGIRARAITGDAELTDLETVATPAAIEQVAALRSENDTKRANDSYSVLSDLLEWSNISQVVQNGDGLQFRDCTESQHVTPGGFTVVNFVTNDVSIVEVDGQLKVDNVTVAQDGIASTSAEILGCVPSSFAERASEIAGFAVDEAERLIEDPAASLAEALPSVFAEEARSDLEFGLQSLSSGGLSRVANETVELTVLGMDVNKPDFTVVVSVCRTYPTGRTYTDRAGEQTTTDLPTGSSYEEWVYVYIDAAAPDGTADVVTKVADRGPNCERG